MFSWWNWLIVSSEHSLKWMYSFSPRYRAKISTDDWTRTLPVFIGWWKSSYIDDKTPGRYARREISSQLYNRFQLISVKSMIGGSMKCNCRVLNVNSPLLFKIAAVNQKQRGPLREVVTSAWCHRYMWRCLATFLAKTAGS